MIKENPCCTGDTLVLTANGPVSFEELAKANNDVDVYCYDTDGSIILSKMIHPRVTGHKQQIVKVTLSNGMVIKVTPNHELLTNEGYTRVEDMYEDDAVIVDRYAEDMMSEEIPSWLHVWTDTQATKKGSIIRTSEVTDQEIEVTWEEREVSCEDHLQEELNDLVYNTHHNIEDATKGKSYVRVDKVEFLAEKETVYNGTVVKLHNYFTYDPETRAIVNQKNCGE